MTNTTQFDTTTNHATDIIRVLWTMASDTNTYTTMHHQIEKAIADAELDGKIDETELADHIETLITNVTDSYDPLTRSRASEIAGLFDTAHMLDKSIKMINPDDIDIKLPDYSNVTIELGNPTTGADITIRVHYMTGGWDSVKILHRVFSDMVRELTYADITVKTVSGRLIAS